MRTTEKKKNYPILLIAAVAALLVLSAVLIAGTVVINAESAKRQSALESVYSRALYDMCDSVNNLEVNLSKLMVASSEAESIPIINETLAQAELAESSLSALPLDMGNIRKTSKYFNQVGDWCQSYSSAIMKGGDTENFAGQAETLYIAARNINQNLKDIVQATEGKKITECVGEKRLLSLDLEFSFEDMENNSIEYPELIYDGPFSDSKKYCFHAIDALEEISSEQALEKAVRLFGLKDAVYNGETDGKTKVYEIEGNVDGYDAYVSVSKKGGMIIGFNRTKDVSGVTLTQEQACRIATDRITELGYENLQPVWYNSENGVGFVNLAPVENGVTYYTDLVKVKVALDDGTILGCEATGYCSAHHERELAPTVSEKTVRSLVNPKITVEKVSLAVIPDGETEKFCYEVYGSYKGLDYFVYVDAVNGAQVDVLRVIDSGQGSMIM